jgi:ribosomal-protein-alanine N-acetyltransferase
VTPIGTSHVAQVLDFELKNRRFFEANINARPPDYYSTEGVERAIASAIADAARDRSHQYLIRTDAGEIVGRINLNEVKRAHFHSAVLGYRIAEAACGKGIASEAVRQMIDLAFGDLGLRRIEANARAENMGSVRVLMKNGFVQFGHSRRSFELGGIWFDRLHFEKHADAENMKATEGDQIFGK